MRAPDVIVYERGWQLPVGAQVSGQTCPYCERRGYSENSFSMERTNMGINYKCHRAKCGVSGFVRAAPTNSKRLPIADRVSGASKFATHLRSLSPVKAGIGDWMHQQWGWEAEHRRIADVQWSNSARRIALPIYNIEEREVGWTLRDTTGKETIKSMILLTQPGALSMSYYKGKTNPKTVIIVEDQASAVRASLYCSAVALLGVHFDGQRSARIQRLDPESVVFCLDKDAFARSVDYNTRFGGAFKKHRAVCPDKDLKNMKEDELVKFLSEECGVSIGETVE